jgi:hypothetical protein
MRQTVAYAIVVIGLAAAGVWVAAEAPPEKAPEAKPALPAGHPMIPQGGGLPPGHPPMAPGSGGMPKGHPPVSGTSPSAPDPNAPPPDAKGTLVVQAIQGTLDGPVAKGAPVIVVLIRGDKPVNRIEAKLDDKGQAVLENVPVGGGVQPLVTVKHGDINYWGVGEQMHAGPPDHRVTVMVYESTEEPPAWVIRMRHIFARRTEEGIYVKETLAVENKTDKTWIGRKGAGGKRVTMDLPLAANTGRLDFYSGFKDNATDLVDGHLVNHAALEPGKAQFQFAYAVPVADGKARVDINCPADTDQLVLVVPEDGSRVSVKGLEGGEVMSMGQMKVRLYKAVNVKAGTVISASLTGIPAPPPALPAK